LELETYFEQEDESREAAPVKRDGCYRNTERVIGNTEPEGRAELHDTRTALSDVKRKLQERDENQHKRRCVDAIVQKESEDGVYYFVERSIRMKRRHFGVLRRTNA
jgi:hypothetical protein